MANAGDVPTMQALAATDLPRGYFSDLRIRLVNVVDLYRLMPDDDYDHDLSNADFDAIFTSDKPVIFNFHGYPSLIRKRVYRRDGGRHFHVRGYQEHGNIDTPLGLAIRNRIERLNLAIDAIECVPRLRAIGAYVQERIRENIARCQRFAWEEGCDPPDYAGWTGAARRAARSALGLKYAADDPVRVA